MLDGITKKTLKPTPACTITDAGHCDPNDLGAFDVIVGNDSQTWRTISDVGLYGSLALPLLAGGLDYGFAKTGEMAGLHLGRIRWLSPRRQCSPPC